MDECQRCKFLQHLMDNSKDGFSLSPVSQKSLDDKVFVKKDLCKECLKDLKSEEKTRDLSGETKKRKLKKNTRNVKKTKITSIHHTTPVSTPVSTPIMSGPIFPIVGTGIRDHIWQYEDHGWQNYDIDASDEIEALYMLYMINPSQCDVRSVCSGGKFSYQVDFVAMTQTNITHKNHTIRNVRRTVY